MTIDLGTVAEAIRASTGVQTPVNDRSTAEFLMFARHFYAQQVALAAALATHDDARVREQAQALARQASELVGQLEELQRAFGLSSTSEEPPNT